MSESVFDPHQLGVEAYLYLYPLVTMEVSRRQMTNMAAGKTPGRAPMGKFAHVPAFPAADFRIVVRPNFDTLEYSVSKFGRTTIRKSAAGKAGTCANWPIGARPGVFPAAMLVI